MTIGELAAAAGTSITRVRFYERAGLLRCACRTAGGHRKYDHEQLRQLVFILTAREFGLGVEQIKGLLALIARGQASCGQVQQLAATHLAQVRARIAHLTALEQILATAIDGCADNPASVCPVLDLLNCSSIAQPSCSTAKIDSV